ncbi:tetraacyldisaccharide 4'-kinase [Lacinutrix salivirga]
MLYHNILMRFLRYLLFPVVPIYFLITWVINKCYDLGIFKSKSYAFPVICVGNLSVGGTGKSPMIEYVIGLLKNDYKLATLSRGYKRKSSGFVIADTTTNVEDIGDEPFQFYTKFGDAVTVAVDANRQNGIENLMQTQPDLEVILLDDAYQHRKVKAGLNILLTTYSNLYCDDVVLPTGNLREPKAGAKRADLIVVTKCPKSLTINEKEKIKTRLKLNNKQQLFFSYIEYSDEVFSASQALKLNALNEFTLVTGIANATPLVNYLEEGNSTFKHLEFKDHHFFSDEDIKTLAREKVIVTTEKDFMRLKSYKILENKLYYLPITISIDFDEQFKATLLNFVD